MTYIFGGCYKCNYGFRAQIISLFNLKSVGKSENNPCSSLPLTRISHYQWSYYHPCFSPRKKNLTFDFFRLKWKNPSLIFLFSMSRSDSSVFLFSWQIRTLTPEFYLSLIFFCMPVFIGERRLLLEAPTAMLFAVKGALCTLWL